MSVLSYGCWEISPEEYSKIPPYDDELSVHIAREGGEEFFDFFFESENDIRILSCDNNHHLVPDIDLLIPSFIENLVRENPDLIIRVYSPNPDKLGSFFSNGRRIEMPKDYLELVENFTSMKPESIRETESWMKKDEREFFLHGTWYMVDCLGTETCEPISLMFLNYYYDLKAFSREKTNEAS